MPVENIKSVVVDASFILAFLLPDEKLPTEKFFDSVKKGETEIFSVQLLSFEVVNSIKMAIKRKRLPERIAEKLIKKFFAIKIEIEPINFQEVFCMAVRHDLTVYDAAYLWLAENKKVKLQTLDKQLKKIGG